LAVSIVLLATVEDAEQIDAVSMDAVRDQVGRSRDDEFAGPGEAPFAPDLRVLQEFLGRP